jgi:hypothetical protein
MSGFEMKDGRAFEENQLYPRGGLEDPLPPAEIEAKFHANASSRSEGKRQSIVAGVKISRPLKRSRT